MFVFRGDVLQNLLEIAGAASSNPVRSQPASNSVRAQPASNPVRAQPSSQALTPQNSRYRIKKCDACLEY